MTDLRNYDGIERELVELIYKEYEKDLREEKFSYKAVSFIKRIFNKSDELPISRGGYIEDEHAVVIHERLKARVITASENKNLIIARTGQVTADIKAVTVYVSGTVDGNIEAKYVFVKGRVNGDIKALNVEILINGHVEGNVETSGLLMHRKGILKGRCDIN